MLRVAGAHWPRRGAELAPAVSASERLTRTSAERGGRMQPKDFGYLTGPQFDFAHPAPCTRSYIIASSERSGSTYLAMLLWKTGFLGAPWEYLNHDSEMKFMAGRLRPADLDDYF